MQYASSEAFAAEHALLKSLAVECSTLGVHHLPDAVPVRGLELVCWQRIVVELEPRELENNRGGCRVPTEGFGNEDEKQAQTELAIRGTFSEDSAVTALFRFPLFMRCIALECGPSFEVLK